MTKTALSAIALVLAAGMAQAQGLETDPAAHAPGGPGGTVGAMESAVYGIATSPQDVALQQRGMTTAAEGARSLRSRPSAEAASYAPGTVGAAPGSTPGR